MRVLANVSRSSSFVSTRSIVTREPVELAFTLYGNPLVDRAVPPLVISHGLFGQRGNWNSVAKALQRKLDMSVLTVDMRNHGSSPRVSSMTYADMAADLAKFMADRCEEFSIPRMNLLGHSMGGKAAMRASVDPNANKFIDRLIIEDVSPKGYSDNHHLFRGYINSMRAMDLSRSRKEILQDMEKNIPQLAIRQFLLTNLQPSSDGRLEWKCNIDAIDAHVEDILGFTIPIGAFRGPTLLLYGAISGYVPNSDRPMIRCMFPQVEFEGIPNTGHWVHAEQPAAFIDSVSRFLLKK